MGWEKLLFILGCKQKHPRHFRIEGSGGGWKRPLYRETLSRLPLEGGGRNNADVGAGPQEEQDDMIGRGWHSRETKGDGCWNGRALGTKGSQKREWSVAAAPRVGRDWEWKDCTWYQKMGSFGSMPHCHGTN